MLGQVSLEFMGVYAALLLIALFVFIIYFSGNLNLFQMQETALARTNSQSIAAAINYVYLGGDGAIYLTNFSRISSTENIAISDYSVTSNRPHGSFSAALLNSNVNVTSIKRNNTRIMNNQGDIYIDQ